MGKITEGIPMNITVYLGANEGSDPALKQAVEELGRWIGESGNALVYGGSRSGLMGFIINLFRNGGNLKNCLSLIGEKSLTNCPSSSSTLRCSMTA